MAKNVLKNKKRFAFLFAISLAIPILEGCNKQEEPTPEPEPEPTVEPEIISDEELIESIEASDPKVEVEVTYGEFEPLSPDAAPVMEDVNEKYKTFGSSSVLDMPLDGALYVVYNSEAKSTIQSSPSLFSNLVGANDQLHTITVKDRGGKYVERGANMLTAEGEKLKIEGSTVFKYGEVYQVSINDADFLCFENKDPSIRTITIEIEDEPLDEKTYDDKDLKTSITNIDLKKVSNKKVDQEKGIYSFEYSGMFPTNIEKGDVFYATIDGKPNPKFDFYGIFVSKVENTDKWIITYESPDLSDIYDDFHMKGEQPIPLEESAEVLITDELAKTEFKHSALAIGIAKAAAELVDNDKSAVANVLSSFTIKFNVDMVGNRLSLKFSAGVYNYKLKDDLYLTVDFGYQRITDYTMDFDVSIDYSWIFPTGVNYKVKCKEDTSEIFYLKAALTFSLAPEDKTDADYTEEIAQEIDNVKNAPENSILHTFNKDASLEPTTSGSRTSWPILIIQIGVLSPVCITFQADFYIDACFQSMLMFSHESHSTKVDFCFSNSGGSDSDVYNEINKSSNWMVSFAGQLSFEVGFRVSLGFSIYGMNDYLQVQAYAEYFINATVKGLLVADISSTETETHFSGFISIDASVICGMRVGLDLKVLIFEEGVSKTLWTETLLRVKYDNAIEHLSDISSKEFEMNANQMSISDGNCLIYNCFNPVSMGFEEKSFKADDEFSIISGALAPDILVNATTGKIFSYEVLDHEDWVKINEDGVISIIEDADVEFDFKIKIHVSNWCGTVSDQTVTAHYVAPDAKEVYLVIASTFVPGDEPVYTLLGSYRPGDRITLPEAPYFRGYKFADYLVGEITKSYYPGDVYTIQEIDPDKILIVPFYQQIHQKYTVKFYDGMNNLVYVDEVFDGESATEPYPAMRDRFMDTSKFKFSCWNSKFDNVTSNLDVYGIYIGIEGGN